MHTRTAFWRDRDLKMVLFLFTVWLLVSVLSVLHAPNRPLAWPMFLTAFLPWSAVIAWWLLPRSVALANAWPLLLSVFGLAGVVLLPLAGGADLVVWPMLLAFMGLAAAEGRRVIAVAAAFLLAAVVAALFAGNTGAWLIPPGLGVLMLFLPLPWGRRILPVVLSAIAVFAAGLAGARGFAPFDVAVVWMQGVALWSGHFWLGNGIPLTRLVGPGPQWVMVLFSMGMTGVLVLCLVLAGVWRVLGARGLGDEGIAAQARAGRTLVFGLGWGGLVSPLLMHPVGSAIFGLVVGAALVVRRARERAVRAQPIKRAQTLSATLITLNEADRVKRCLESLRDWVDEIIVLDSGSTDNTVDIARCYTDKVYVTDWPGYGLQKQRALEHATCDWVLSIDADEVVTPELRHDIDAALSDQPDCVGYRLPWGVVVYGKLLDFGRSARAPLRLFQRDGSRFTDAQVHETVKLPPGRVGTLDGRLLHYTHRDYGHALRKSAHYAWLGAQARFARGRRGGGLLLALLRSWWVFVQVYVFRLGLLDGQPGLLVALTYAQGSFNKYAGLWTLRRQAKHKSRD